MINIYRRDLEEFMKLLGFDADAASTLLALFDEIVSNDVCRAYLEHHVTR